MKFLSNVLLKAGLIVEGTTDLQGTATAVTQALSDSSTKIATTAFVKGQGYVVGNIYSTDGSLSGNRTITLNSSYLDIAGTTKTRFFSNGNIVIDGANPVDAGYKFDVNGTVRVSSFLTVGSDVSAVIKSQSSDGSIYIGGSSLTTSIAALRNIIVSTVGSYSTLTGINNTFYGRAAGLNVTSGASNVFIGSNSGAGITTGARNVFVTSSDAGNLPSSLSNSIHLVAGNGYRSNDASSIPSATHTFIGGGFNTGFAIKDFYFGQMPFTADAGGGLINIVFYAPSGLGTDIGGANFTLAAGRGTGAGTPGDFIIRTSNTTTTGSTLQALADRIRVAGGTGIVTIANLAGTGSRMVVADSSGVLSTQAIISGNFVTLDTTQTITALKTFTSKATINTGGTDDQLQLVGTAPSIRLTNAVTGATINGFIAMAGASNNYIQGAVAGDMTIGNQNNGRILFGFGSGTADLKMSLDASGNAVITGGLTIGTTLSNGVYTYTLPSATGTLALASSLASYVPTSRTLTINGTTFDLSANRSWSIATGVSSVASGTGISVSTVNGVATVTNLGLLSASSGTGISVSTNNQSITVTNLGLLSAISGTGISASTVNQQLTITNLGLLSAVSGTGISVTTTNQQITVTNTGILSIISGTGISASTVNGATTITNLITNTNQLTNGAGYITSSALSGYATQSYVTSQGYITGINSSMVTGALGYTPYNSSNPSGYITASALSSYLPLSGGTLTGPVSLNNNSYLLGSSTFGFRFNNAADTFNNMTLTNGSGDLFVRGQVYVGGNGSTTGTQVVSNSGTWGISITGNAATVGGVQLDNIVWGNARGTNDSVTTDNDALDKTGYYTSSAFINRPSGVANWMYIEHIKLYNNNSAYQKQIGYDTYDDRMWVRTENSGTWTSWKQIWTSSSLTNLNQLTNGPGYITGYTETDTLSSVTGRGNSTGSNILTSANMYANVFYDYYDNGYYFQGRGISRMYGIAIRGDNNSTGTDNQIYFWGAGNTTTSAIGFKANGGYFTNPTGFGDGYNTYLTMDSDGRGWVFRRGVGGSDFGAAYTSGWILNNGVWQANASMRAPIFYDSQDTNYYVDPNSTSRLNILSLVDYQYIAGQTENGQSHYQWEGATYRNPGTYNAALIIRRDNSTTGLNGSYPSLVLYNHDGRDQSTVAMSFATRESNGGGNAVPLGGIIAKKSIAGNNGGWSSGSLTFYVKDLGNRRDALYLDTSGYAQSEYSFRAPQFRFTNSTNSAYLTGDSDWGFKVVNNNGYIQFGPANGSWSHIYSDKSFYFNQELYINNVQVVKNTGTWGISITGSAGNADTVDGYHASTSTIGNYIVVRDGNGYIFGNYINMTDNVIGSGVTGVIVKQGDNYYRTGTAGAIQSFLGLGSMAYQNTSSFANVTGSTSTSFGVLEINYAATNFNPATGPRTNISPMSVKMWNNYFNGTGLGSDYGTVMQYYSLGGHVDSQVYFDAAGGSWYRTASYNSGYGGWQRYLTDSNSPYAWNMNQYVRQSDDVTFAILRTSNYIVTPTIYSGGGNVTFGNNIGLNGNNAQIQFNAAASADLFISAIPGTRTVEIRNGNSGSPNYAACGLITGYATFTSRVTSEAWTTSGRNYSNEWIEFPNYSGLYSPLNGAHLYPNNASYGSWRISGSRNGWRGIEFDSGGAGNVTMMISNDSNTSGFHNNSYGWQTRWANGTLYVGKNSYGGNDATVLDSSNYSSWAQPASTAITTSNISSQSVNFATTASSAGTITGRQRGSFTVGGNVNTFYPVAFQIGSGATGEQGVSVLQIERGGYDEPGYSNYTFSTFHARIRAKADGWGYGASYVQVEANAYTVPMMADVTQQNQTSQLIVWLRGGCSYRWMDIEGGWSLNFSNPSGGNYSTFNGNSVYGPTGTNTIGSNFKYQQGWGNNYISGTLTAGGDVVAFSDARVKENIRPIENALDRVCKSRGVLYDRIDIEAKNNIGFIAQELEEEFPELVTTDEAGKKSVKYQNATAVLFEAIKEQQKQIRDLKSEVNALTK